MVHNTPSTYTTLEYFHPLTRQLQTFIQSVVLIEYSLGVLELGQKDLAKQEQETGKKMMYQTLLLAVFL